MQRWRGLDSAPPGWGRCVVTIGMFDGLHAGHREIVARAVARASSSGLPSVLLTFDPHPSEVVRPGSHPAVLTEPRFKAALVESLGVDVMCVLPFTPEFSRLTPDEFAHTVLVEHLHAAAVVVGENFRFGRKAAGSVETLTELGSRFGFAAEGVPLYSEVLGGQDTVISSTFVRACVAAGDVELAARALGRPHRLEGVVVRGDRRGREIGYPTANLELHAYAAVPADGVYAGWLRRSDDVALAAAISIGTNPTFQGAERRVEAFVLDIDDVVGFDLYGEHVALDFVDRLRETVTFDGVEALVDQMGRDVARTRALLSAAQ